MSALLIGYARVSTDQQDLTSRRDGLAALGVAANRIYVDHGLTGTNRERPGLREALAACREGDTLVVTKLDRLARSLPDARAIADELTVRQVSLNLGGSVYNPNDPVGRLLFNVLAMVAEFESDLIRLRTREGMKVAKAKGHLRGRQPKLNHRQEAHLVALLDTGEYTTADLADQPFRRGPFNRLSSGRARKDTEGHDADYPCARDLKPVLRAGRRCPVGPTSVGHHRTLGHEAGRKRKPFRIGGLPRAGSRSD
jgi:DNA invertase Pin-like site-specific DNA recombinase